MISLTEPEFRQFCDYVKLTCGINLSEKKHILEGRLAHYLAENNFNSFSDYLHYILHDKTGAAVVNLVNKLTTNYTFFMREAAHFSYFSENALPYLTRALITGEKDLRIWSAGCSTGEEPYTLAMIIADFFAENKKYWDTRILATDISRKVLEIAINGIYDSEQAAALPEQWRRKYLRKIDQEKFKIVDKIRNEVIFRAFNLNNPVYPFKKKFHVIFCRNVMIYFDSQTKRELLEKLYDFTEVGGYLFIGHAESLKREETKYRYIMPAVYRKE